jgi:hypothetical protein
MQNYGGAKGLTGLKRYMQKINGQRLIHHDKYSDPPQVLTYRILRYQSPESSRTQQRASGERFATLKSVEVG